MGTEADLESLSSTQLHDLAVHRAVHRADLGFFWELLRAIPAAEAMEGDVRESEADAVRVSNLIADALGSGEGKIADELRPLYIGYLKRHEAPEAPEAPHGA